MLPPLASRHSETKCWFAARPETPVSVSTVSDVDALGSTRNAARFRRSLTGVTTNWPSLTLIDVAPDRESTVSLPGAFVTV